MKMSTRATRRIITVKVKVEEDKNEGSQKVKAEFPLPNAAKQSECIKDETGRVQVKEEEPSSWTSSPPAKKGKGGPPRKYFTEAERREGKTEKARLRLATMTPEQREQRLQKRREQAKRRRERLTEEERNELKRKRCEYERMHLEKMAKEKKEEILKRKREWDRKRKATLTAEESEAHRRRARQHKRKYAQAKKANLTEEEKKELREKQREKNRKKYKETKKTEEEKKKLRHEQYFRVQAKLAQMTPEERKEWTRKNTEAARKWRQSLTGEKRQRYLEYVKRKTRRYLQTDNFKSSEVYTRLLEYQRNRVATETPEERQKRLRRYKINQAVTKLRKELEEGGVSKQDIEMKAMELKKGMWAEPLPPPEKISTYTPRKSNCVALGEDNVELFKSGSRRRRRSTPSASKMIASIVELNSSEVIDGVSVEKQFSVCDESEIQNFDGYHTDAGGNYETEEEPIASITPLTVPPLEPEIATTHNELTSIASLSSAESTKCPHCSSHFPQKCDLIAHVSSEHPKKLWKCPVCKVIALNPSEFKEHFKSAHASQLSLERPTHGDQRQSESKKSFNCIKCDPMTPNSEKVFGSRKELNEHFKSKHRESYWPCSKCDLLKYSKNSLRIHEKVCSGQNNKLNKKIKKNFCA